MGEGRGKGGFRGSYLRKIPLRLGVESKALAGTELILLFCRYRYSRDGGSPWGISVSWFPAMSSSCRGEQGIKDSHLCRALNSLQAPTTPQSSCI